VIVTVDQLSDALAAEIVRSYGTHDVAVEVDSDEAPNAPAAGRWNDTSAGGGFYGGARLSFNCTDAFSWHSGPQR
jgi:hypothetical protein